MDATILTKDGGFLYTVLTLHQKIKIMKISYATISEKGRRYNNEDAFSLTYIPRTGGKDVSL